MPITSTFRLRIFDGSRQLFAGIPEFAPLYTIT